MIDTIKVKFLVSLSEKRLNLWDHSSYKNSEGVTKHKYIYDYPIDNYKYRFTYYPFSYTGDSQLNLEISLPKAVFGNNYTMVMDIPEALTVVNQKLKTIAAIPPLDLGQGILIRLDICYNYQVGDMVDDYVIAIGNLDYPHRNTQTYRYQGVVFHANKKKSKFYNKQVEAKTDKAYGLLRHEVTLSDPKDIQKFLNNPKPTLLDISLEQAKKFLEDDLKKLRLFENSIATRSTALKRLCETHGNDAGIYYYALLILKVDKSKKEIVNKTQMHPRSLDRKLKKIVNTGVPPYTNRPGRTITATVYQSWLIPFFITLLSQSPY